MRPRSLLLLASLVLGVVSNAQQAGLGVHGGLLFSTVRAVAITTQPISGASFGIHAPVGIGPRLELQPELGISALGTHYTEPDGEEYTDRTLYVQAPISLKLFLTNTFHFSGGYQFGKLISAQRNGAEQSTDVKPLYESMDMGFILGTGVDFASGVDVELRYYSAMTTNLVNDDALYPKNRSLQLTVGYRFVQFQRKGHFRRRG
jgi:hypothetical protein